MTENVIECNDLHLQQPEPITEEQGHNAPNAGFNHQRIEEQNVENPKKQQIVLKIIRRRRKMQINYKKQCR